MPQKVSRQTAQWQQDVSDTILEAIEHEQPLRICAGRSKLGFSEKQNDSIVEINLSECTGVIEHDPSELYIIARAGTSLDELVAVLASRRQQLPFEPPLYKGASLGGAVATGITGSSMPYRSSLRDSVLAVRMVNGLGHQLCFGAPVIKNVAGFDVARLMAGSYGTLGALIEITVKVTAMPEQETTLVFDSKVQPAIESMLVIDQKALPVTAQCWYEGQHFVRLSGSASSIDQAQRELGGSRLKNQAKFWAKLHLSCFPEVGSQNVILRCTCKKDMPANEIGHIEPFLIDWSGGLRWYSLSRSHYLKLFNTGLLGQIQRTNSHMWRIIYPSVLLNNLVPLQPALKQLYSRIKNAFDPHNICNPDINWHSQDSG